MSFTEDVGKIINAGGSGVVRRASSTRRFMRCLVTERRATFLDTTTAYPFAPLGRMMVKCADEIRRPVGEARERAARESRSRR